MFGDIYNKTLKGIIPRSIEHIFKTINTCQFDIEFILTCSMLEIYKETLYDLLSVQKQDLKIKESTTRGIYVEGLTQLSVGAQNELLTILELGEQARKVSATRINQYSSRSHTIFMLEIKQRYPNDTEKKGKLNLVDLAGSEKVGKTGAVGDILEEAKKINLSLSCLGNVIHSLTSNSDHIPYRDSKLTRILQESLGGNFKTSLIVTCSSHSSSLEETLSTLKFATRAKFIKNHFKMNIKNSPDAFKNQNNVLMKFVITRVNFKIWRLQLKNNKFIFDKLKKHMKYQDKESIKQRKNK
ncbi:kinesin motor domain protein [Ichthyophthirius multifiliis]|uniref:Kinesin-like protein n=1 Tax=Ichthyophthirius multifiliis TaxID=5932 RepID=G0R4A1_ICHMU|nr:kinesin motor domain protein [Ichthyophthirius multifiliis]EGR27712.1 kinesin motor domain protein [Ichthyophthirius multifiliis]|eukprot:XP_004025164.1 kinesin motor domain protein [Ichthyophthirius multifiliis]